MNKIAEDNDEDQFANGQSSRDLQVRPATASSSTPPLDWGNDPRAQGPRFRILGLPDNGTFAEFVKVPAANVFPRPAHLSDKRAAALPLAGLTA